MRLWGRRRRPDRPDPTGHHDWTGWTEVGATDEPVPLPAGLANLDLPPWQRRIIADLEAAGWPDVDLFTRPPDLAMPRTSQEQWAWPDHRAELTWIYDMFGDNPGDVPWPPDRWPLHRPHRVIRPARKITNGKSEYLIPPAMLEPGDRIELHAEGTMLDGLVADYVIRDEAFTLHPPHDGKGCICPMHITPESAAQSRANLEAADRRLWPPETRPSMIVRILTACRALDPRRLLRKPPPTSSGDTPSRPCSSPNPTSRRRWPGAGRR